MQLLVRNGDVGGPVPYGSAKCYNVRVCQVPLSEGVCPFFLIRTGGVNLQLNMNGGPGASTVSSVAWVYEFTAVAGDSA